MEAIVRPFLSWDEWPQATRAFFQGQRSPACEDLILQKNLFIDYLLPLTRPLQGGDGGLTAVPTASRAPDVSHAGLDRDLPIAGEPHDVTGIVESYAQWMAKSPMPKLFIDGDPAGFLIGAQREFVAPGPINSS